MSRERDKPTEGAFRQRLYEIIFRTDDPLSKGFDIALLIAIALSVVVVMLESVADFRKAHGPLLQTAEWFFTVLFTLEYFIRIYCVRKPSRYIFSFFGLIDLLSIIPTYLSLFIAGSHYLLVIRVMRLLRVFRVLKMTRFLGEAETLKTAIAQSSHKIIIFVGTVLSVAVIIASIMHLVEGADSDFTSIPRSMYWAIVTLTTVGYGDIAPATVAGQAFAAFVMILGYGIIAVPTGIVSAEIVKASHRKEAGEHICTLCISGKHDEDAVFCKHCGRPAKTKARDADTPKD